jgi:hypothetical protein
MIHLRIVIGQYNHYRPDHFGDFQNVKYITAHAGEVHFGETNPSGEHARERWTNLRLHKMAAGVISLFPACYLQ